MFYCLLLLKEIKFFNIKGKFDNELERNSLDNCIFTIKSLYN